MHEASAKVDCVVNVLGKPYQTALSLLSLLRHSGAHIDTVFFITERSNADSHAELLERLPKVECYTPRHLLWIEPIPRRGA